MANLILFISVVVVSLFIYDKVFVSKLRSSGNIKGITNTYNGQNVNIDSKTLNGKFDSMYLSSNKYNSGGGHIEVGEVGTTIRGKSINLIAKDSISFSLTDKDGRTTYLYTKDGMQEIKPLMKS